MSYLLKLQKLKWILKHPYLALKMKKLLDCRAGEFVFSDFSHSTSMASNLNVLGVVAVVNRKACPGKRILIVNTEGLSRKVKHETAKLSAENFNPKGSGWHNWHLIRRSDCLRMFANKNPVKEAILKLAGVDIDEKIIWTATRGQDNKEPLALFLSNHMVYAYNRECPLNYLAVLRF